MPNNDDDDDEVRPYLEERKKERKHLTHSDFRPCYPSPGYFLTTLT